MLYSNEKNNLKINLKILFFFFIFLYLKFIKRMFFNYKSLAFYKHYINECNNLKRYNRKKIKNTTPFFSICFPAYNMENYIAKAILSVLNQSFQNFEIIIVNDYSNDSTKDIIKKFQTEESRIKLINHSKNLGVYYSRVDAILLSRGKYIILMDPDDMLLNPKLLEMLYDYNLKYNLDIIEFSVICFLEKKGYLKIIEKYYHYHNFNKKIIYQPELSDIHFYNYTTKNFSKVQCRVIWNKIIRREILLKSIQYIGLEYYKKFFITAEDTLINIICFHFANNYSNIDLPGYMYNIREISMTHGKSNIKKKILFCYNHLLYLKKFYLYLKDFNKSRIFFLYEFKEINKEILKLNKLSKKYKIEIEQFFKEILNDKFTSITLKNIINNISSII